MVTTERENSFYISSTQSKPSVTLCSFDFCTHQENANVEALKNSNYNTDTEDTAQNKAGEYLKQQAPGLLLCEQANTPCQLQSLQKLRSTLPKTWKFKWEKLPEQKGNIRKAGE